jgi:hypothetical protein
MRISDRVLFGLVLVAALAIYRAQQQHANVLGANSREKLIKYPHLTD